MAVGDVVTDHQSVNDAAYLDIQPGAGAEWLVSNLYAAGEAELYKTDGTNEVLVSALGPGSALCSFAFHLTNGTYLRIKNVSGGPVYCGYDGRVTQ